MRFLAPICLALLAALAAAPLAAADLSVSGRLDAPVAANVFYICVDEPPYPGAPDYSGDFCVDGSLFPECVVMHHWTDRNGPGERCYVEHPLGPASS